MAAVVTELFKSRTEIVNVSAELVYHVTDAADEDAVKTAVASARPATYAGLILDQTELIEKLTDTSWLVHCRYKAPTPAEAAAPPDPVVSGDSTGGVQHITQSLGTAASYGDPDDDLNGAIGYDGDAIQGCDIVVPVWNFEEKHYIESPNFGNYYALTGKVNSDAFTPDVGGTFPAGSLLFLGVTYTKQESDTYYEVTFRFSYQPNQTGLTVGGIPGVAKLGWQYMWIQYGDDIDGTSGRRTKVPVAVYVENVYNTGAFSGLGL